MRSWGGGVGGVMERGRGRERKTEKLCLRNVAVVEVHICKTTEDHCSSVPVFFLLLTSNFLGGSLSIVTATSRHLRELEIK